jgi:hypothetical protein
LLGKPNNNGENWIYTIDLGHRFGTTVWTYNLNIEFEEIQKRLKEFMKVIRDKK